MSDDDLPTFDAGAFDDGPLSNPRGCGVLAALGVLLVVVIGLIAKSGEALFNG